ncbi:MAG: SIR2 family protein [Pseudomonadota bacterium]|nr:SIR2 family protein [Pseudomonadota bacterium]
MVIRFESLSGQDKKRLCDLMVSRRASLFLGAGVSRDSAGSNPTMRSAGELCRDLVELNSLPQNTSLQRAYSRLSEEQKSLEITEHYTCTTPGETIKRIADHPWQRVYTLNVDNCLEIAFRELSERRNFDKDSLETFNFVDSFSELSAEKRCSIVHLHGYVKRPADGYVFSTTEYAKFMSAPNSWMLTLSQLIRTDLFIVAGSSFDEVDIEYYLTQRSQSTIRRDVPMSILIEPYPNVLTEDLCNDHEFCLFEGTVLEFFSELEAIDPRISNCWIDNEDDGLSAVKLGRAERLRFSAAFETIPDDPGRTPNPARFLLGAELTWPMISANSDMPRDVFSEVRDHIIATADNPDFRLFLIVDTAGAGKTAFLKRLAFDISRGPDNVFWHSGLNFDLGPKRSAEIIDSIPGRVYIFVDNFADNLNAISLILERLSRKDIAFVCTERDYRLPYIENAFTGEDYRFVRNSLLSTRSEALALRALNVSEGLSTIASVSDQAFIQQSVNTSIAEVNCRIQNNFRTLDAITESLRQECDASEQMTFLTVALARFCFSMGVRRSILSVISSHDNVEYLLSDSSSLPIKYSDHNSGFVVPKISVIGDRILEIERASRRSELLRAFVDLATALAPRVNIGAIRRRSPDALLLGRLMDYDNNIKRLIDQHAEEFYARLKPLCEWNARYWEQMSLLKLDRFLSSPDDSFLLQESVQHARAATSIEQHPFSLTTLAKVLLQAMDRSPSNRDQYFSEAWTHLVIADEKESRWPGRGATLFVVCFDGVIRYLDGGGQLSGEQNEKLRDMIAATHRIKSKDRGLIRLRERLAAAI